MLRLDALASLVEITAAFHICADVRVTHNFSCYSFSARELIGTILRNGQSNVVTRDGILVIRHRSCRGWSHDYIVVGCETDPTASFLITIGHHRTYQTPTWGSVSAEAGSIIGHNDVHD